MLEVFWHVDFLQVIQRSDHEASVLASQLVGCLSHVDWFKLVFTPEIEQFSRHAERCANVVNWEWSSLTQFLKDRLQVLLGSKLFFLNVDP